MKLSAVSLFLLLIPSVVVSQTTSTEILGTVVDPSGASVPGAKITLRKASTGETRQAVTNNEGNYSFPLIDVGDYTVKAAAAGFKTEEQKGITVQLQQKARIDFQMQVGAATDVIEVSATGVALKTEDAAVGGNIDNKRVVELPLNGRNVATLAVLIPGVQFGVRMGLDGSGGFPIPGNGVAISANGQREVNQQVTLDGVIATEPRVNTAAFSPSIDALEEFKVQTSSYSAEYGQNSGAIMQMVVKSGTNQLHGTLYEFLRNDKFAAKDYFLNFQQPAGSRLSPKNVLRRNQFGVFVGGPILFPKIYNGKDRSFWSFNYEGRRETRESVAEAFWFPEAFRRGDFSSLLTPPLGANGVPIRQPTIIFDPLTGEPFRNSQGQITNIIPASRINKAAQDFINKYQPLPMFQPTDPLDINSRGSVPNIIQSNQTMFRIDHAFSPSDKVFVRYITDRSSWTNGDLNPNLSYYVSTVNVNVAAQYIKILNPTSVNEFRYGLNKADDDTFNPRTNTGFDLDSLGLGSFRVTSGRKLTEREVGLPSTVIGGDRDGGNGYDRNTVHQFTDNLSLTRGSHTFKTGVEVRRLILDRGAANSPRGSIACCPGGYNLAGWLMGYFGNTETGEGFPFTAPRQNRYSAYFLDDWKVTRKLTMNVGLRWDYFQVPRDSFGAWRSLRLDVLTQVPDGRKLPTVIPDVGTKDWTPYDMDNRYFMPRIGLAYRATNKWVVRSGFGWFANAQQLNNYTILNLVPPVSGTIAYQTQSDILTPFTYNYAGRDYQIQTSRLRPGFINSVGNIYGAGTGTVSSVRNTVLVPPDNKSSNHWQWSLDLQRNLPANMLLTVAYVGSKTNHLDNTITWNNPDPAYLNTDIQSRRPYPYHVSQGELDAQGNPAIFGIGNIRYLDSYGNGSYHGLQVNLEKRYSHGLTFGYAYTYSKSMGEGYGRNEGGAGIQNGYQNPRDRRQARSRFGFDVTHNTVFNFVYEMPFLNKFKGVPGVFLAGWQTNGVFTIRTGFPFTLVGGNLNTGGFTMPDRVADGRLGDQASRQLWYDITAFRRTDCNINGRPDLCHYGNSAMDAIVSPGGQTLDFSIFKNWKLGFLGEQGRIQFRSEFFNLLNHPNFGQPNGIGFATTASVIPDAPRNGEIRSLRNPMRVIQFAAKIYF
ncbi:MAG TPA: TonB-dependent receptor [Bryobacteraceae bacterium]|nr:TonB-dependent receptor [Bryobacteraceae bacterium]